MRSGAILTVVSLSFFLVASQLQAQSLGSLDLEVWDFSFDLPPLAPQRPLPQPDVSPPPAFSWGPGQLFKPVAFRYSPEASLAGADWVLNQNRSGQPVWHPTLAVQVGASGVLEGLPTSLEGRSIGRLTAWPDLAVDGGGSWSATKLYKLAGDVSYASHHLGLTLAPDSTGATFDLHTRLALLPQLSMIVGSGISAGQTLAWWPELALFGAWNQQKIHLGLDWQSPFATESLFELPFGPQYQFSVGYEIELGSLTLELQAYNQWDVDKVQVWTAGVPGASFSARSSQTDWGWQVSSRVTWGDPPNLIAHGSLWLGAVQPWTLGVQWSNLLLAEGGSWGGFVQNPVWGRVSLEYSRGTVSGWKLAYEQTWRWFS